MPKNDKVISGGVKSSHRRKNTNQGTEASQKSAMTTPVTPTFPGAAYGFNQADQPSLPPRRISSAHSLKHTNRSATSLHTSPYAPPPLPAPFASNSSQRPPDTPYSAHTAPTHFEHGDDADDVAEELAWGPEHPCFPHLNPHVPLDSPEYLSTRIIRIRRDWMIAGDLAPTYSNVYPEILDPLLPETQFRYIIEHINATLIRAYDPFRTWNWIEGLLGLATGWFWEDFRRGGSKHQLLELEKWMEEWNQRIGWKDGVRLIPLRRTGYLGLDIEIPDPQVRIVNEDDDDNDDDDEQAAADDINTTMDQRHIPIPEQTYAGQFGHISTEPARR